MFAFQYNSIIQGPVTVKAPFSRFFFARPGQVFIHNSCSLQSFPFLILSYNSVTLVHIADSIHMGADYTTSGASATATHTSWELLSALRFSPWSSSALQRSMKPCLQYPSGIKETFLIFASKAQSNQF